MKLIKSALTGINFTSVIEKYEPKAKYMHEGMTSSINLEDADVREAMSLYIRNGLNPTKPLGKRHKFSPMDGNYPELDQAIETIGLDECQCVIMSQEPGMFNMWHNDEYGSYGKRDKSQIRRVLVFLTDYKPCQFLQWGGTVIQDWQAGDIICDWGSESHGTANASEHTRIMLRLTGVVTDRYNNFIRSISRSVS
jgi:hypothetical protein